VLKWQKDVDNEGEGNRFLRNVGNFGHFDTVLYHMALQ